MYTTPIVRFEYLNTYQDIDITTLKEAYIACLEKGVKDNVGLFYEELISLFDKLPFEIQKAYFEQGTDVFKGIYETLFGINNASIFQYTMISGACLIFDYKNKCFSIKDKAGKMICGSEKEFYAEVDYIENIINKAKELTVDIANIAKSSLSEEFFTHYVVNISFIHDMLFLLSTM